MDLVDVGQKEIKDKAIELKKAKRKYLNDNILNNINTKFKKIKKKKAKEFKIYKEIIVLLNEVGSSKKQNDFEKGYKSKHWKKKMEGFFVQWDQLSNKDLDINKFFDEIDNIYVDLISAESNINENIDTLQTEIQKLEEELANKWPIKEIAISVIIFFVICVGGYFIYDSGQKRKREREEAESKIASLKNDLEGKFKSTSEQIKSVSRTAARSQETFLENEAPESIHEQPKTPEEIITEKYDQLMQTLAAERETFRGKGNVKSFYNELSGLVNKTKNVSFWMKNTYIPLDIIGLNEKYEIVELAENMVPLDTNLVQMNDIKFAIEVNAGTIKDMELDKGEKIKLIKEKKN